MGRSRRGGWRRGGSIRSVSLRLLRWRLATRNESQKLVQSSIVVAGCGHIRQPWPVFVRSWRLPAGWHRPRFRRPGSQHSNSRLTRRVPRTSRAFSAVSIPEPKMTVREGSVVIVSSVVALAAILGGAFYPGPRVVIGVLLAVALGWAVAVRRGQLVPEEWVALGFVVWGVVSAALAAAAPLACPGGGHGVDGGLGAVDRGPTSSRVELAGGLAHPHDHRA